MHPSSGTTGDRSVRHATCAGNRAGTLVSHTLVAVSASDEEHGGTVGDSSDNRTAGNDSAGRVDLVVGSDGTSKSTSVTRAVGRSSSRVVGGIRGGASTSSRKRAGGVDQRRKAVDCGVVVVPEGITRCPELSSELGLQVLGDGEKCSGGDKTLVPESVHGLQSKVDNVFLGDVKTVRDSHRQEFENLSAALVDIGGNEFIVQLPFEANLSHEAVCWHFRRHTIWRCNHLGQSLRNTTGRSGGDRRCRGSLLNDAGR